MAGTMALDDVVADLKRSLHDSATVFNAPDDADFVRFVRLSLADMGWKRPATRLGQVALTVGEPRYALAGYADFGSYKTHLWNKSAGYPQPWEPGYPGALPRVTALRDGLSSYLVFDPAPSSAHLAALGSTFKFWYFALHTVDGVAANTTVAPQDRGLLMLRAQAEAMRELSIRNAAKPVQLRDGLSGTARNSTPAALYEALLAAFMEAR